jgi:hypothetical protein
MGLQWSRLRASSSLVSPCHHQWTNMVQAHHDSHEAGTTTPIPPAGDWKDLAWVLRSSKDSTAAPSRASWLVALLPGMSTARPPTARHYRG